MPTFDPTAADDAYATLEWVAERVGDIAGSDVVTLHAPADPTTDLAGLSALARTPPPLRYASGILICGRGRRSR